MVQYKLLEGILIINVNSIDIEFHSVITEMAPFQFDILSQKDPIHDGHTTEG